MFLLLSCTPRSMPQSVNQDLCIHEVNDDLAITADYSNQLVKAAYDKISLHIPDQSYYAKPTFFSNKFKKIDKARRFIDELCIEYHDNTKLLTAKLNNLTNIFIVPEQKRQEFKSDKELWPQLTGEGYRRLILISDRLDYFRKKKLNSNLLLGRPSLAPISVCEIKFIFNSYLAKYRTVYTYSEYLEYENSLKSFLKLSMPNGVCEPEDLDYVYAFRGEGFLKPLSSESRIMNYTTEAANGACLRKKESNLFNQICDEYAKKPFQRGWYTHYLQQSPCFIIPTIIKMQWNVQEDR
jgi:hypothetical protein